MSYGIPSRKINHSLINIFYVLISNYDIFLTRDCLAYSKVKPAVNQIEAHPLLPQDDLVAHHKQHNIHITAYSPLGNNLRGEKKLTESPQVIEVAQKNNVDPAQVLIAWGVHRGYSVIPKSVTDSRIKKNFEQITLSDEDYQKVTDIGKDRHVRFNVGFLYTPQWDINVFNEEAEKQATHSIKIE